MRTSLRQLGEAHGWRCWLCAAPVDPDAPAGAVWAASVDHVVPRSLRGEDAEENRRLAHRGCNSARGNRVPELAWPRDLALVDAAPLFPLLSRQRPGDPPVVAALFVDDRQAARARGFVVERASLVFGGTWEAEVRRERAWFSLLVRRLADGTLAGEDAAA